MNNKETLYFYLVAFSSAAASVAAICAASFWRATGGLAVGFALLLPALVLACFGYAYPSPLNKVRCGVLMGNVIVLPILYLCMFIVTDLAGAKVVFRTAAGVFQPNAAGVLLILLTVCGLVAATLTTIRVIMHAFGHSLTDAERKLLVQSRAAAQEGQGEQIVVPRNTDATERLAKADQEVRMSRMSVVPTGEAAMQDTRIVSPAEARQRIQRRHVQPTAQSPQEAPAMNRREEAPPVVTIIEDETPMAQTEPPLTDAEAEDVVSPTVSSAAVNTPPSESTQDIIYAPSEDVDDVPAVEVEMAHGEENISNADIRTETAVNRPRQKETSQDDDIYTDFAYSAGPKDDED